jgi:hypothetical protein
MGYLKTGIMKKIVMFAVLVAFMAAPSYGQNKYSKVLLEQIAALKIYAQYAQKGYSIAKKGLDAIGKFKDGEFSLHTNYFTSWGNVNPAVRMYGRAAQILFLQGKILQRCTSARDDLQGNEYFHGDELDYVERVFARLMEDCERILTDLEAITRDNQLKMKDSERIERIDMLYVEMMDAYSFCEQFTGDAKMLVESRRRDGKDIETSRHFSGL